MHRTAKWWDKLRRAIETIQDGKAETREHKQKDERGHEFLGPLQVPDLGGARVTEWHDWIRRMPGFNATIAEDEIIEMCRLLKFTIEGSVFDSYSSVRIHYPMTKKDPHESQARTRVAPPA